jgi:molybdopterin adenylyltransferase
MICEERAPWLFPAVSPNTPGATSLQSHSGSLPPAVPNLLALPGSPGTCRVAWDDILKRQIDGRFLPCNLVELMQRLQAHLKARA